MSTQLNMFPLKKQQANAKPKSRQTRVDLAVGYDAKNLRIARQVLQGDSKYRGGCLEKWARVVLFRLGSLHERTALDAQVENAETARSEVSQKEAAG